MKSPKQVKETGEYKTQKKDESSSEEECEQNASDDDWDQVEVNTSSSNETSDEDSVPAKPLPIIYDCESTAADIYKDHIVEIAATAILPEHISSSSLTTNQSFQSLVCTSRRILPAGTCIKGLNYIIQWPWKAPFKIINNNLLQ